MLAGPEGALRTLALFFSLLGCLLVIGLSAIGAGAVMLSRFGSRPREVGLGESLDLPAGGRHGSPLARARP